MLFVSPGSANIAPLLSKEDLVDQFLMYNCPSLRNNYIVSRYKTDGLSAREFCESHGALLPGFTSNSDISNVFDCLNDDYHGDLKLITILISVTELSGGTQKLTFGDEDVDTSLWSPYDPNGDCALPISSNLCCAKLVQTSNHNFGIAETLTDSDVDCSCLYEYFLCQITNNVTILGDECALDLNSCSHSCSDEFLGYTCSCPEGYQLGSDQYTCEDVDECRDSDVSPCSQACVNVEGSYECECYDGYSLGGHSQACQDDDECALGTSTCDLNTQRCVNVDGSFQCECLQGYEVSGSFCTDIDECLENTDDCLYACFNTNGGFNCICPNGYQIDQDGNCNDVDECTDNVLNTCEQTCSNVIGSFYCSCHVGFEPVNSTDCEDINECNGTSGLCEHDCVNKEGSYYCTCHDGYSMDIHNTSFCVDNNECTMGTHTCNVNTERCVNTDGSFQCICLQGYQAIPNESCGDINECEEHTDICNQTCVNTDGSYHCDCTAGFKLSNNSSDCLDIDECGLPNSDPCDHICVNLYGSYQCLCYDGYNINRNGTCARTCDCSCKTSTDAAEEADPETVKKELIVPRSELSSYTRAKTSAPDTRTSAQSLGYFGLCLMVPEVAKPTAMEAEKHRDNAIFLFCLKEFGVAFLQTRAENLCPAMHVWPNSDIQQDSTVTRRD
ncbi:latent-transforming growth factor beta-binding protein 2 [Elysia marginata]|uniref:Latent-transforming growth factor beta-binding protein 2 n=1 Tax=Elysia marginata TaxID=1093978 RepID=A0AAV4ILC8_9GAST|nr:latent-transforming growth factor beta-binding protein 2 [Elysia marginata]